MAVLAGRLSCLLHCAYFYADSIIYRKKALYHLKGHFEHDRAVIAAHDVTINLRI